LPCISKDTGRAELWWQERWPWVWGKSGTGSEKKVQLFFGVSTKNALGRVCDKKRNHVGKRNWKVKTSFAGKRTAPDL